MEKKIVLIGCRIFEEELNAVLEEARGQAQVEMVWLDAGLHSDLALLERELGAAIDQAKAQPGAEVRLLFGQGCLPHMQEFAQQKGVKLSTTRNCLAAFLGEEQVKALEADSTMLLTPGWVRTWPGNMRRVSGWDAVDFRLNLGRYQRLLLLEPGLNPLSDEEIIEFFDLVQVPLETQPLDLGHFRQVVGQLLG